MQGSCQATSVMSLESSFIKLQTRCESFSPSTEDEDEHLSKPRACVQTSTLTSFGIFKQAVNVMLIVKTSLCWDSNRSRVRGSWMGFSIGCHLDFICHGLVSGTFFHQLLCNSYTVVNIVSQGWTRSISTFLRKLKDKTVKSCQLLCSQTELRNRCVNVAPIAPTYQ